MPPQPKPKLLIERTGSRLEIMSTIDSKDLDIVVIDMSNREQQSLIQARRTTKFADGQSVEEADDTLYTILNDGP